jgi:Protein of unknown function (DUF4232)
MQTPKAGMLRIFAISRRLAVAGSMALIVAGCSASAASLAPAPSDTLAATTAATATTATPAPTGTPAPTITDTPAVTATSTPATPPTAAPTTAPTAPPVAPPAATPKPTPTPLPALAIGLCTGAQLHLSITSWVGDPGAGIVYAHVTATNASSASCSMRGMSEAQILNASGAVIADAGSGAAKVQSSDPVYALAPNGTANTIIQWGNWCKSAPSQNLKVAVVEPFGLGRVVSPANGVGNVPTCYASASATVVSSEAWTP